MTNDHYCSVTPMHMVVYSPATQFHIIIIIIITSSGDLQPSTAIANQLPSQIVSTQIRTTSI